MDADVELRERASAKSESEGGASVRKRRRRRRRRRRRMHRARRGVSPRRAARRERSRRRRREGRAIAPDTCPLSIPSASASRRTPCSRARIQRPLALAAAPLPFSPRRSPRDAPTRSPRTRGRSNADARARCARARAVVNTPRASRSCRACAAWARCVSPLDAIEGMKVLLSTRVRASATSISAAGENNRFSPTPVRRELPDDPRTPLRQPRPPPPQRQPRAPETHHAHRRRRVREEKDHRAARRRERAPPRAAAAAAAESEFLLHVVPRDAHRRGDRIRPYPIAARRRRRHRRRRLPARARHERQRHHRALLVRRLALSDGGLVPRRGRAHAHLPRRARPRVLPRAVQRGERHRGALRTSLASRLDRQDDAGPGDWRARDGVDDDAAHGFRARDERRREHRGRVLAPQPLQLSHLGPLHLVDFDRERHRAGDDVVPVLHPAPQRVPRGAVRDPAFEALLVRTPRLSRDAQFRGRGDHSPSMRGGVRARHPSKRGVVRRARVPRLPVVGAVPRVVGHERALVEVERGGEIRRPEGRGSVRSDVGVGLKGVS
eukprot:31510-Pelagococcus_subviridis.AAC.13